MVELNATNDAFIDQIMRAIVQQFFENPQVLMSMPDGTYIPPRATPVQALAARMLADNQEELLNRIMEKIDPEKLAGDIAAKVSEILLTPNSTNVYNRDANDHRRSELQKKVDERLVELMAADLFAKMQERNNVDDH